MPRKTTVRITYFVHGTTIDNERGLASGWNNTRLSELGIRQSKELRKQIHIKRFDAVFTSDLRRAVDSARLTFGEGTAIIRDRRLRECNYGEFTRKDSKVVDSLAKGCITRPFPEGESYKDVEERIRSFLEYLLENYGGKHVAIVAHKAPQLALEVILNGKTWRNAFRDDWRRKGHAGWKPGWGYTVELQRKEKGK